MLEDEGVCLGGVQDPFMEFCINKVNEEGVGEEDG